jgi:hypothetical protein
LGWVTFWPPSPSSALPPVRIPDASPKAISGRTSYLLVRLAFHLYPHLIGYFCNSNPFGPPTAVTPPSPWTWVAHQVSCLINATLRPFQTRFRFGSACSWLNLATLINSPAHSPKGTRSRRSLRTLALPPSVSERFQILFHSPHRGSFHLSLTVLVRYRSSRVFSLGEWSPPLPTGLACPVVLWFSGPRFSAFVYGTLTLSGRPSQCRSTTLLSAFCQDLNPACLSSRFGLIRFRSPLLAESFLFLRVLRCFSSPGSLPYLMCSGMGDCGSHSRVSPFGYRRFFTCTRFPDAFRSVPRPSSALDARASPVRLL